MEVGVKKTFGCQKRQSLNLFERWNSSRFKKNLDGRFFIYKQIKKNLVIFKQNINLSEIMKIMRKWRHVKAESHVSIYFSTTCLFNLPSIIWNWWILEWHNSHSCHHTYKTWWFFNEFFFPLLPDFFHSGR